MPTIDYLTSLLEIQGFRVVKVERKIENERSGVILELERTTKNYICSGCGRQLTNAYDSRLQVVQHLSLWQHVTYLRFKRYRLKCPDCGVKVEALDFVDKYARVTTALSALVYELCKVMTCKAAALFQCLHRGTVKAIDKGRLQKAQKERPLNGITAIGIDEISIGKGHNYWHLISALLDNIRNERFLKRRSRGKKSVRLSC